MAGITVKFLGFQNFSQIKSKLSPQLNGLYSIVGGVVTIQFRERRLYSPVNLVRPRYPVWFLRKEHVDYDQALTEDNRQFIGEMIQEKFGPPAVISGVSTYQLKTPLRTEAMARGEWTPKTRRTGLIGKKIGHQPLWDKNGNLVLTTMIQIVDNHVVKYTPPEEYVPKRVFKYREKNRYGCLLVGTESADPQNYTREYCGLFASAGLMPKKRLAQFMISPEAVIQPGTPLYANHWKVGDVVDVKGNTVFRGFEGVMVRHGFHGMPATHGQTKTHRRGGNTGGGGEKARIWPGTKMPGHMGNRWRVNKGLKIWRINTKYNILYVQGTAVPGECNSYVYIYDTILPLRKAKVKPEAFPTFYPEDLAEPLPEDIYDEQLHNMAEPTIMYKPEK